MRVVIDINVFVSALVSPTSPPGAVYALCVDEEVAYVISDPMLRKLTEVLNRRKFHSRISELRRQEFLGLVADIATERVDPEMSVSGVTDDEEDDVVLGTALAAEADVLITGDRGLLAIGDYRGIRIMTPREFLDEWTAS